MKALRMTVATFALGLAACGRGGGNSASAIEGIDLSGTYEFDSVFCANSAGNVTNESTVVPFYAEAIIITGNKWASVSTSNSCQAVVKGRVVFTSASTYNITGRVISDVTNGSCTQTIDFVNSAITPNVISGTVSNGQTLSDVSGGGYTYNSAAGLIGFRINVSDGQGGFCMAAYHKQ